VNRIEIHSKGKKRNEDGSGTKTRESKCHLRLLELVNPCCSSVFGVGLQIEDIVTSDGRSRNTSHDRKLIWLALSRHQLPLPHVVHFLLHMRIHIQSATSTHQNFKGRWRASAKHVFDHGYDDCAAHLPRHLAVFELPDSQDVVLQKRPVVRNSGNQNKITPGMT
jgi:hypothetical protein